MKNIKGFKSFNESLNESQDLEFFGFDISKLSEFTFYWEVLDRNRDSGQDWSSIDRIQDGLDGDTYNMIFISSPKGGDGQFIDDMDVRIDLQSVLQSYLTTSDLTWEELKQACDDNGLQTLSLGKNRVGFYVTLKNSEIIDFFGVIKEIGGNKY